MGGAASCLGGGDIEVTGAHFHPARKPDKSVREFSRTETYLNIRVHFNRSSKNEVAVVTWSCVRAKGGKYRPGQLLFVDELGIGMDSKEITSTYELNTRRKAWPAGSYKVEVHLKNKLAGDSSEMPLGRKKLTGHVSQKKLDVKGVKQRQSGRLVLTMPFTIS